LIVAIAYDDKGNPDGSWHAIGRQTNKVPNAWHTKLSTGEGGSELLAYSGNYVDNIKDFNAHFDWYFRDINKGKLPRIEIRAFACDPRKMKFSNTGRVE
jgi:hypothetical protein